jgi:predicted O-methyltransferase YrrM
MQERNVVLRREKDWFGFLGLKAENRDRIAGDINHTLSISAGMMHPIDVESLSAACLHSNPGSVFEIGTYKGASAEHMLRILPDARVISIAFPQDDDQGTEFNNSELRPDQIGSLVNPANRPRFTQLLGDSHRIDPSDFLRDHGQVDFVFIDGDHSRKGVRLDTELALKILAPGGAIAWHDANPRRRYMATRRYLEQDLELLALATADDYLGGVAFWTAELESRLRQQDEKGER